MEGITRKNQCLTKKQHPKTQTKQIGATKKSNVDLPKDTKKITYVLKLSLVT
jgi:hypothetical protein